MKNKPNFNFFFLFYLHSQELVAKNHIPHMTTSGIVASNYLLIEIDDHLATTAIIVNFTDHSFDFHLKFSNGSRFVHINL